METDNPYFNLVIERISGLNEDVNDLRETTKDSIREITQAVNKLILIEERQSKSNEAFALMLAELKEVKSRLSVLEQETPLNKLTNKAVTSAIWTAALAAVAFVAKYVGLIT